MSTDNNNGKQKHFSVRMGLGITYILASILLAGGLVVISSQPMNAIAQGEENGNDTTTPIMVPSTIGNNRTTSTSSSSGIELSPQPIWDEKASTTGVTPINQTHTRVEFVGHGTMTVPDTGETINMTNTGYAIITGKDPVFAYGRENVFSKDGDTTAITYYEIVRYDPAAFQGKGIIIAVFDNNATGMLAPFNGMIVTGTHEEDPRAREATITLWKWEGGIGNNNSSIASVQEGFPMNMTSSDLHLSTANSTP